MATTKGDHERLVEEILDEVFDALDTSGSVKEGGFGSQRDAVEETIKGFVSPEDLLNQLRGARDWVEKLCTLSEDSSPIMLAALQDCQQRVWGAYSRAKRAADMDPNPFD